MVKQLLLFIAVLSLLTPVTAINCDGVHLGQHTSSNGTITLFCVPQERLQATAAWDANLENLPLMQSQAMAIASAWIEMRYPQFDRFELREFSIERIVHSAVQDRFHYDIHFQGIIDGQSLFGSPLVVKVLMDGSVVEPEIEKPKG